MFDNMREWIRIHMDEACNPGEEIEYLETMIEEAEVLLEQQQRLTKRAPDVMPCGHPLTEAYQGEDSGTYCRICESA